MELHDGAGELRVRVLGGVHVSRGDVELPAGPPQRRAVLALLAFAEGQPVGRDELVDALWPTAPPRLAMNVIHTHVKHLRRMLEPGRPARVPSRLLPSVGPGYQLDTNAVLVDLLRFRRLIVRARAARTADDCAALWDLTGAALRLWRPPVPDVPMLAEHPRIAAVTTEAELAFSWRVDTAIRQGRVEEVLPLVQERARTRPLDEQAQAHLMRCYLTVGRRADAFAVYAAVRERLVSELGVDPVPVLTAAHQELLVSQRAPDKPRPARAATPPDRTAQSWPPPAQLPADVVAFTGRVQPLQWLDRLLAEAGPPVAAVTGTAGVGKTALTVHWAHRVADRFPDGQLYVDLQGFGPERSIVDPFAAIRSFLGALQVPPARIPADRQAQRDLYRTVTAGRRLLVLLDNARDADQVRPLLPGTATARVVVTSRNLLMPLVAAEGAHPLSLDLLSRHEAEEMLSRRIGEARVAAEPTAVERIVTACANLPLALTIAAARARQSGFPLAAVADELTVGQRLDALEAGDAHSEVRTVLSWSYATLTPAAARLFRFLGRHPGPDFSAAAATSLAGRPAAATRRALTELTRASLLTETAPGRYVLHDLLREYAADLVDAAETEAERRAAHTRLLDHYTHTAQTANRMLCAYREPVPELAPPTPGSGPERFNDIASARAWLSTEHRVLLAVQQQAAESGFDAHACQLAWGLDTFLFRQAHWHDLAAVWRTALGAADRLAHPVAQGHANVSLARAVGLIGDHDAACAHMESALGLFTKAGNRDALATAHLSFGALCDRAGHFARGLRHTEQARILAQALNNRRQESTALNNLGWQRARLGEYTTALAHCEQALALLRPTEFDDIRAGIWHSLGWVHHHLSHHASAIDCYRNAAALHRRVGARYDEARTLLHLGDTHDAAGQRPAARIAWHRALDILTELDHPDATTVRGRLYGSDQAASLRR